MPQQEPSASAPKRRRTESDVEAGSSAGGEEQVAITQSSFWLEDGSIVLQAESTQFKVHKTVLSRHSTVFRDMFEFVQPSQSEPRVEGCPLIYLSDRADELHYILEALYDHTYTSRRTLAFPVVSAMLRLGSKYDFSGLREEALVRLSSEFPSTLGEWEKLSCEYTHMKEQPGILFDIVNLALEQGIYSILPGAYYLCIQDIEDLMNGAPRGDGTVAQLSPEVQRTCILGREKILNLQAEHTLGWLEPDSVSDNCTTIHQCALTCSNLLSSIYRPIPQPSRSLEKWSQLVDGPLCSACTAEGKALHDEGRRTMWDLLPMNFGFPPWNELKRLDR